MECNSIKIDYVMSYSNKIISKYYGVSGEETCTMPSNCLWCSTGDKCIACTDKTLYKADTDMNGCICNVLNRNPGDNCTTCAAGYYSGTSGVPTDPCN